MIFGSMKEVFLVRAMEMFLFDCFVAGFDSHSLSAYRCVLKAFIYFAGNIKVKQMTPHHVELYVSSLCDGPDEEDANSIHVMSQYAMIQTWVHWMHAQSSITERTDSLNRPVDLEQIFPPHSARRLAHCE